MVAVLAKKATPAQKGETPKPMARPFSFPAPTLGWVLNENLKNPSPASARVLDNWICTPTTIKVRGGCQKYATIGASDTVVSMFSYRSGASEVFFAATGSDVFDISTVADPDVIPTAAITGQTSGYYSTQMFGNASGAYLFAANGSDAVQRFDGAAWSAPALTGVSPSALSHVWVFASRVWFVEKDTMSAWYLGVDAISGAATEFSLAGVMTKGGSLLFGATWSLDAGDGLDDKCIFVSTEGEVAVYEGTDPSSATTWSKVGVYQIGKPIGQNATMQAGGDLLVATEMGLVPISEAIRRDVASLSLGAVSRKIEPYWQQRSALFAADGLPWEIQRWASQGIIIVSQPRATASAGTMLVANLQTGAWSRFTGMDARCLGYYAGYVYYGDANGVVRKMQATGADDGIPYTATYLGQHEQLGAPGAEKTVVQMRPAFVTNSPIAPQLTAQVDYSETLSVPPSAYVSNNAEGWDISTWDASLWDAIGTEATTASDSRWVAIGATGYAVAPELQITFGGTFLPSVELIGIDAMFTAGAGVS